MQHGWNVELDSTETILSFADHLNQGKSDETGRIRQYWIKKKSESQSATQPKNLNTSREILTWPS